MGPLAQRWGGITLQAVALALIASAAPAANRSILYVDEDAIGLTLGDNCLHVVSRVFGQTWRIHTAGSVVTHQ